MKTKILLVELPIDSWNRPKAGHYLHNPGTLSIGTYLKQKGYNVKIIDSYAQGLSWNRTIETIRNERPDIVGSSSYTTDIYGRILLARTIKKINPSIVTVLGGYHVSLAPEETLRLARDIDYAVIGEGEETFSELVGALENGKLKKDMHSVKGLAYFHDGEFVTTEPRPLIEDLDELPMPDYSMIPMDKYRSTYFPCPPRQSSSCWFSRGCIEKCSFCSATVLWQHCWRGRSAMNIVNELMILNKKYGKKAFVFTDNDFLFNRKRNLEFIEEMKRSGLKIDFRPLSGVKTLLRNKDLLGDLRKIGLTAIQIGIESYNQDTLNKISKNYEIEQLKEISYYIKKAKIPYTRVFLIVGHYEDDRRSILGLIKKTKEYGFGAIQISCSVPWPGTQLFYEAKKRRIIEVWDYRRYDWENAIMSTRYLSLNQVNLLKLWLFFKWYFDIFVFMRNLTNRYLRHYHILTLYSVFLSLIHYSLISKFKKLFKYNRLVNEVYKDHLAYIRNNERLQ